MKVFIVDNASVGVSESYRWNKVVEDLKVFRDDFQVFHIKHNHVSFHKYHESTKYYSTDALSNELLYHLKTNLDNNSVFIFANARDPLVLALHNYRIFYRKQFKIIGFWTDSIHLLQGNLRKNIHKTNYAWSASFEKCLIDAFDYNLVPYDLLYDRLYKMFSRKVRKSLIRSPLPFDSTLKDVVNGASDQNIYKDDLIILNTSSESLVDFTLFNAIKKEFSAYEFINVNEKNMNPVEYQRILARSKVVLSLNISDADPYTIVESMALGSLPILPDLELYKEMFHEDWIYSSIIFKPPYLNFIRNREEIFEKILKCVENYVSYSIDEKYNEIVSKYYNSDKLKEILCSLIAQ